MENAMEDLIWDILERLAVRAIYDAIVAIVKFVRERLPRRK
jgi:hypothetical protein